MLTKEQIKEIIDKKIAGQGNQVDCSSVLSVVLTEILESAFGSDTKIGDIAELETDHKSNIVEAINEVFDVIETTELVVSMSQTNPERKVIYDECMLHPQLAKNIVFYDPTDNLYYRVNGYNVTEDYLLLHAIMKGESGLRSVTIQILPNGSIAIL